MQLPDIDRQIALAWSLRSSAGIAATLARIDELLDMRLTQQAPPPYAGECQACRSSGHDARAVIVPMATAAGVVRLTWCRRCDTRTCGTSSKPGCGAHVTDPKALRCPECQRLL
ncbi:MAG TPA: hypothetical protein VFH54_06070 [Mycobacteriales bacterium]|nr:hypothetical protein [Mycobacteriales bacterium]